MFSLKKYLFLIFNICVLSSIYCIILFSDFPWIQWGIINTSTDAFIHISYSFQSAGSSLRTRDLNDQSVLLNGRKKHQIGNLEKGIILWEYNDQFTTRIHTYCEKEDTEIVGYGKINTHSNFWHIFTHIGRILLIKLKKRSHFLTQMVTEEKFESIFF